MEKKLVLNQVVAVTKGMKSRAESMLTKFYQELLKTDLFSGLSRKYEPLDETGERYPDEYKNVQKSVKTIVGNINGELAKMFDMVARMDTANATATADIEVDGKPVVVGVPVTTLIFLEKRLEEQLNVINKLPVLDPAQTWEFDENAQAYKAKEKITQRTKKVMRNHTLKDAIIKDGVGLPAQVQVYTEDQVVGHWHTIDFSGYVTGAEKARWLANANKLQQAIVLAREKANMIDAPEKKVGEAILGFIYN